MKTTADSSRRNGSLRALADRLLLLVLGAGLPLLAILFYFVVSYHGVLTQGRWPLRAHRYHPLVGYVMSPGVSAPMRDGTFHHRTHRLGYRIPREEDADRVRPGGLLSLGCSFTYGDEVEAADTFTQVAAEELGIPAYNFGVCAYNYATMILQLRRLREEGILDQLGPSVLVVGVGNWLIRRSLHPFLPSLELQYACPYLRNRDGDLGIAPPPEAFHIRRLHDLLDRYFPEGRRDVALTPRRAWILAKELPRILRANWHGHRRRENAVREAKVSSEQLYTFLFTNIRRELRGREMAVVALWFATRPDQSIDPGLVQAAREAPEILLVDGGRALRRDRVDPEEYCCGRHPQPLAHRAYGEAIVRRLREVGLGRRARSPTEPLQARAGSCDLREMEGRRPKGC